MTIRNPSEIARLEDELSWCKESLSNGYHSKKTKEYLLRSIREIERNLGIESKPYNSSEGT